MADETTASSSEEQGAWARPVPRRIGEIAMALAILLCALFFVWQGALLPFGGVGLPGPGFFPFALGLVLGLFALAMLYVAVNESGDEIVYVGHRDILIVLAALAGVAFAFEQTDAYLTLGAFSAVVLLLVGRAAPLRVAVGVVVGMIAVWAMFKVALGVRLPAAEFWSTLTNLLTIHSRAPL